MSTAHIPSTVRFRYDPILPAALTALAKAMLDELAKPAEERSAIFSIRMYGYVQVIPNMLVALHEEREHPESVTAAKELLAILPRAKSYVQRLERLAQHPQSLDLYTSVHQSLTNFLAQPTPNPTNAAP